MRVIPAGSRTACRTYVSKVVPRPPQRPGRRPGSRGWCTGRTRRRGTVRAPSGHQSAEQGLRVGRLGTGRVHPADRQGVGQAGGVGQQLTDRRLPRTGSLKTVDVLGGRCVEVEPAVVGEAHRGSGGDDLGHGEPQVGRVGCRPREPDRSAAPQPATNSSRSRSTTAIERPGTPASFIIVRTAA